MIQRVPVLIVGGGGAGLTASMLFAEYGIESLLVSALATTSVLPKAHVLHQRAMEVFTDIGVADAIYAESTPAAQMSHTGWYLDVAGDENAGRLIHKMECRDGGYTDPSWVTRAGRERRHRRHSRQEREHRISSRSVSRCSGSSETRCCSSSLFLCEQAPRARRPWFGCGR